MTVSPLQNYRGSYRAPQADELVERIEKPPADVPSLGAAMLSAMSPNARKAVTERTGKSTALIHRWGSGARYPGEQERAVMRDAFGIPTDAWKMYRASALPTLADAAPAHVPEPPPSPRPRATQDALSQRQEWPVGEDDLPSSDGTLADQISSVLVWLTKAERSPDQLKQAAEIRQALALQARVKGQMATKIAIQDHPDFAGLVETMLDAVEGFPGGVDRLLAVIHERKGAPAQKAAA